VRHNGGNKFGLVSGRSQGSVEIQELCDKVIFVMLIIDCFHNLGGACFTFGGGEKIDEVRTFGLQNVFVELERIF
jgi:hypothetical protein